MGINFYLFFKNGNNNNKIKLYPLSGYGSLYTFAFEWKRLNDKLY